MAQGLDAVNAHPGFMEDSVADVGRKNLDRHPLALVPEKFKQADGNGIDFLPGGTPRHPDADRVLGKPVLHELRKYLSLQMIKGLGIAKKTRHMDEQTVV